MITFQEIYSYMKEHNILTGILIFDILSLILFPLTPFMFIIPGDVDIILGAIIGFLWAIRYREKSQQIWKIVLIVGILGSLLSTISITIIAIVLSQPTPNFNESLLIFSLNLMIYELLSLIIGMMIGIIFYFKKDSRKIDLRNPKL